MIPGATLLHVPTMLASDISVGEHLQHKVAGLTINLDTVWATGVTIVIMIIGGLYLRSKRTSGVPGKPQLMWEMVVGAVQKQVDESIGAEGARIVPLAVTLFVFIFIADFWELIGIGSKYEPLPAPTGDINLPLAMSIFVIVLVHVSAMRNRGFVGYFKHYFTRPFSLWLMPVNLFMNVVDEIVKPVTLALRLFGNILAGGLMLSLLAALTIWKIGPAPIGDVVSVPVSIVWRLFELGIGTIQAFIFSLLAVLYFGVAMAPDEAH